MDVALYDLSPSVYLLGLGAALAVIPFAWVWWRHRGEGSAGRWHAITVLTLFLTFDLVLFGAFTRLTDSGLGCPDWPGCYGSSSPFGAAREIQAAEQAMPSGPVTTSKAWIEMVHRYIATALGALITVTMLAAWLRARTGAQPRVPSPRWATATFVWVCLQGAFGAWTVTMKLNPAIVTLHLLGGYIGLTMLTAQSQAGAGQPMVLGPGLRRGALGLFGLVFAQSALGGWVSTNYAVLACRDFPTCQDSWWPAMDFGNGFNVLRDLGMTSQGTLLPFEALTAIHYVHRLAAYLVLCAMVLLAWRLATAGDAAARRAGGAIAALAAWQLLSGLSNVVLGWPLVAALAHTGGAGATIVVLTAVIVRSAARRQPAAVQPAGCAAARMPAAVDGPSPTSRRAPGRPSGTTKQQPSGAA
jgi:cytochrome c oxidase assembly protein subunit 15